MSGPYLSLFEGNNPIDGMRTLLAITCLALMGCAEERVLVIPPAEPKDAASEPKDALSELPAARQAAELGNLLVWLNTRQAAFQRKIITLRLEMHDIDDTQQLVYQPEFDNGIVAGVIRKEAAQILKEDLEAVVQLEAGVKQLGDQIEAVRARLKRLKGNKL